MFVGFGHRVQKRYLHIIFVREFNQYFQRNHDETLEETDADKIALPILVY
jgi:hypothetical protein